MGGWGKRIVYKIKVKLLNKYPVLSIILRKKGKDRVIIFLGRCLNYG